MGCVAYSLVLGCICCTPLIDVIMKQESGHQDSNMSILLELTQNLRCIPTFHMHYLLTFTL